MGTIGETMPNYALDIVSPAGDIVNLQSDVINIGTGNFNFASGSAATSTLVFNNGITISANINNTTLGPNIGTVQFLGNATVDGTIGASNSLYALNLTGGAGTTVTLEENANVGAGNINFATNSTETTVLAIGNNVALTSAIGNTTFVPNIGTVQFLGNSTVTGTIGMGNSVYAINLVGPGSTVNFDSSINVGSGDFNFASGANATTTANFLPGVVLTSNFDNLTGTAANGIVKLQGSGQITGNIGETKSLNQLLINSSGAVNQSVQLNGNLINVSTINVNDDRTGNPLNGSALSFINNTGSLVINSNITATTMMEDMVYFSGTHPVTVNGNIGTPSKVFNTVWVCLHSSLTVTGNIYSDPLIFEGNNTLTVPNKGIVTGTITTTNPISRYFRSSR